MPPEIFSLLQLQTFAQTLTQGQGIIPQDSSETAPGIFDSLVAEYTAQNDTEIPKTEENFSPQTEQLHPAVFRTSKGIPLELDFVVDEDTQVSEAHIELKQSEQTVQKEQKESDNFSAWRNLFADTRRAADVSRMNRNVSEPQNDFNDFDEGVVIADSESEILPPETPEKLPHDTRATSLPQTENDERKQVVTPEAVIERASEDFPQEPETMPGKNIPVNEEILQNTVKPAVIVEPEKHISPAETERPSPQNDSTQQQEETPKPQIETPEPQAESLKLQTESPKTQAEIQQPQTESTQPQSETPLPQAETPKPQLQAETPTPQPQAEAPQPQEETQQLQYENPQSQTESQQSQIETSLPQTETPKPQTESTQTQSESPKPQPETQQPQTESTQPQSETPQTQSETPKSQAESMQPQTESQKTQTETPTPQPQNESPAIARQAPAKFRAPLEHSADTETLPDDVREAPQSETVNISADTETREALPDNQKIIPAEASETFTPQDTESPKPENKPREIVASATVADDADEDIPAKPDTDSTATDAKIIMAAAQVQPAQIETLPATQPEPATPAMQEKAPQPDRPSRVQPQASRTTQSITQEDTPEIPAHDSDAPRTNSQTQTQHGHEESENAKTSQPPQKAGNDSGNDGAISPERIQASPARISRTTPRNDRQESRNITRNDTRKTEALSDFQSFFDSATRAKRTSSSSRVNTQPLNLRPATYTAQSSQPQTLRNGIVNTVRFIRADGVRKANIIVDPPALGRITVELTSSSSGVEASVKVANEQIRQIVQEQFTQLKDNLIQQGVQVSEFTVDVQQDNSRQGQDSGGHNQRDFYDYDYRASDDDDDTENFRVDLEEGLLYWIA